MSSTRALYPRTKTPVMWPVGGRRPPGFAQGGITDRYVRNSISYLIIGYQVKSGATGEDPPSGYRYTVKVCIGGNEVQSRLQNWKSTAPVTFISAGSFLWSRVEGALEMLTTSDPETVTLPLKISSQLHIGKLISLLFTD
jgi:hypothetical protein